VFFHQLIHDDLGCACYVLGAAGRAVVVDPGLDVDAILAVAAQERAQVELILETHVHADHVSGRDLLARRTGARVRVPAGGEVDAGAGEPMRAGEIEQLAGVRLEAIAAPGHRPEHLAFAVSDLERSPEPWLLLSGDSLLVGDLARPDLAIEPQAGSAQLHDTLARLRELGDHVEVWPGHVGGSLCGGPGLAAKRSSTIGYERRANPLLDDDIEGFTRRLMAELPTRPPTVARVVARNRAARPLPDSAPPVLDAPALAEALDAGAVLIDGRDVDAFDAAHRAGAINLPLGGQGLGTRAGWLLGPDDVLVTLADDERQARVLARLLAAVGLDVRGVAAADAQTAGGELVSVPAIPVQRLDRDGAAATLIDVRDDREWRAGHVPGSVHLPMPRWRGAAREVPAGALAVACANGPRAAIVASWLRRGGRPATRVSGGGIGDLLAARRSLRAPGEQLRQRGELAGQRGGDLLG
jgi:glyoxylase-like metal-dependent hydrolase (beta-lactamase superfamily II)/rhodanese-related sulfurtransferase